MLTQRNAIVVAMKERGWDVAEVHDPPHDWWADEHLVLESRWAPVGAKVFLTFLVDPQWEGSRTKGEAVWAVIASTEPLQQGIARVCGVLNSDKWKTNAKFAKMRDTLIERCNQKLGGDWWQAIATARHGDWVVQVVAHCPGDDVLQAEEQRCVVVLPFEANEGHELRSSS